MNGFAKQYTINGWGGIDLDTFLDKVRPSVFSFLSRNRNTKVFLTVTCKMRHKISDVTEDCHLASKTQTNMEGTNLYDLYKTVTEQMLTRLSEEQEKNTGWIFQEIVDLRINSVDYKPLKGKSYIPLASELASKRAIINMKNEKDECFKWCVTRALNPVQKNQERVSDILKVQSAKLCWKDIKFPMSLKDIDGFERNNPTLAIYVYGYEKKVCLSLKNC